MVHPQKRFDMKKALEACIGRILEVRHWMVRVCLEQHAGASRQQGDAGALCAAVLRTSQLLFPHTH
jgi:hypothetical protein